jgi:hypothetical protein
MTGQAETVPEAGAAEMLKYRATPWAARSKNTFSMKKF